MTSWPKMRVLGKKLGNGWCDIDPPPNELDFTFGCSCICAKFGDATVRVSTDGYTDRLTQIGFIICPMLHVYAIAMKQIIIKMQ